MNLVELQRVCFFVTLPAVVMALYIHCRSSCLTVCQHLFGRVNLKKVIDQKTVELNYPGWLCTGEYLVYKEVVKLKV